MSVKNKFQSTTSVAHGLARQPLSTIAPPDRTYSPDEKDLARSLEDPAVHTLKVLPRDAITFMETGAVGRTRRFARKGSYLTGLPWREDDDPY